MAKGASQDEHSKTGSFSIKRHKWIDREIKTPVVKWNTIVKRTSRFFQRKSHTSRKMNNNPISLLKVRRDYDMVVGLLKRSKTKTSIWVYK